MHTTLFALECTFRMHLSENGAQYLIHRLNNTPNSFCISTLIFKTEKKIYIWEVALNSPQAVWSPFYLLSIESSENIWFTFCILNDQLFNVFQWFKRTLLYNDSNVVMCTLDTTFDCLLKSCETEELKTWILKWTEHICISWNFNMNSDVKRKSCIRVFELHSNDLRK